MRIAVCDDNAKDLARILSLIGGKYEVSTYDCAEKLLPIIDEDGVLFDLYILDIFMKKITGVELARRIRIIDERALICFTSTSSGFYREAYNLYAFQYLLKPIDQAEFTKMLESAAEHCQKFKEKALTLSYRGKAVRISIDKLLYIESQGHTLYFYCKNGRVEKQIGQLSDFEAILDKTYFIRTHQSYIANLYNVDAVEGNNFVCGGKLIPISRKYISVKENFRKMLFEVMG